MFKILDVQNIVDSIVFCFVCIFMNLIKQMKSRGSSFQIS